MDLQTIKFKADASEIEKATHIVQKLDSTMSATEKTLIKQDAKMAILRGQSLQLADGIAKLGDGWTQSQAKQLANLAILDATKVQLEALARSLKEYNQITGTNPFDKSVGGVSKLRNEIAELQSVNHFMNRGLNLTKEEIQMLSRDSVALTQVMKSQGASIGDIARSVNTLTVEYSALAKKKNELVETAKQSERAAQEEARRTIEAQRTQAAEEMRLAEMRKKMMREYWEGFVPKKSPEQMQLSEYFKNQEDQAKASMKARDDIMKRAESLQNKSIQKMFMNHQAVSAQQEAQYQKDMGDLRTYYSGLEKADKDAETSRKASYARMFQLHQMKTQQEKAGYDRAMSDMRKYYSDIEKQEARQSKMKMGGAPMDAAVLQFYKERDKATKASANANKYLADAEARLNAALATTNSSLGERYTDRLVKYQSALAKSGLAADVAAKKFDAFKNKLNTVASKERSDQLRYLSRAISVQMGDVGVSLASGMNPLLVMIQQGDQIRGVIQHVGASADELKKVMGTAAMQIAKSFIDTGKAIGSFFVGSIVASGKAIIDLGMKWSGASLILGTTKTVMEKLGIATMFSSKAVEKLNMSLSVVAGAGMFAAIAAMITYLVQLKKIADLETTFTKTLALKGAALGMSTQESLAYVESLKGIGVTTKQGLSALTAFAEEGIKPNNEMMKTSSDLLKYAGVEVEETAKAYAKLKDKPTDALIEIAKQTGYVTEETILQVEALEKQEKYLEAAQLAMSAKTKSDAAIVKQMKADLNDYEKTWIKIKEFIGGSIDELVKAGNEMKVFSFLGNVIMMTFGGIKFVIKQILITTGSLATAAYEVLKSLFTWDWKGLNNRISTVIKNASQMTADNAKTLVDEMNDLRNSMAKEAITATDSEIAALRKLRSEQASAIELRRKAQKNKTEGEKESERIAKEELSVLQRVRAEIIKNYDVTKNYTKAQKLALSVFNDKDFAKYSDATKKQIVYLIEQAHAEELTKNAIIETNKWVTKNQTTYDQLAKSTRGATDEEKFFGSFLENLNIKLKEHVLTLEQVETLKSMFATTKYTLSAEKLDKEFDAQKRLFQAEKERAEFMHKLSGTQLEQNIEIRRYELTAQKIKELQDLEIRFKDKSQHMSEAQYEQQKQRIQGLYDEKSAWAALSEEMKKTQDESTKLGEIFTTAFSDMISGGKSFGDVLKNLERAVADLIIQVMILEPLKASLTSAFKSGGGISGMISTGKSFFGFADGGNPPVNQPSIVGERGPELFVPRTAGTIIPNDKISTGSTNNVVQNISFNISAPNGNVSRDSIQQIQTAMGAATNRALRRNS